MINAYKLFLSAAPCWLCSTYSCLLSFQNFKVFFFFFLKVLNMHWAAACIAWIQAEFVTKARSLYSPVVAPWQSCTFFTGGATVQQVHLLSFTELNAAVLWNTWYFFMLWLTSSFHPGCQSAFVVSRWKKKNPTNQQLSKKCSTSEVK